MIIRITQDARWVNSIDNGTTEIIVPAGTVVEQVFRRRPEGYEGIVRDAEHPEGFIFFLFDEYVKSAEILEE